VASFVPASVKLLFTFKQMLGRPPKQSMCAVCVREVKLHAATGGGGGGPCRCASPLFVKHMSDLANPMHGAPTHEVSVVPSHAAHLDFVQAFGFESWSAGPRELILEYCDQPNWGPHYFKAS
jgi:hypothetical protein